MLEGMLSELKLNYVDEKAKPEAKSEIKEETKKEGKASKAKTKKKKDGN
jgi:hypothetical protein